MSGKPIVLFVDDEATTRRIFDVELTTLGIPHYIADSSENAVHILIENHVDIIVTDLMMPKHDGTDLIGCVRKCPDTQLVPIILLTGGCDPDMIVGALNAGATTVLIKQVTSTTTLVERIYNLTKDANPRD